MAALHCHASLGCDYPAEMLLLELVGMSHLADDVQWLLIGVIVTVAQTSV
jgi:hypothetical protein